MSGQASSAPQKTGKKGAANVSAAFRAQAGKGRPKGVLNKNTIIAKDMIAQAAERMGGLDRLVGWMKEDPKNESVFWGTIYPKLLPLQVSGEGGGPLQIILNKP